MVFGRSVCESRMLERWQVESLGEVRLLRMVQFRCERSSKKGSDTHGTVRAGSEFREGSGLEYSKTSV